MATPTVEYKTTQHEPSAQGSAHATAKAAAIMPGLVPRSCSTPPQPEA